MPESTIHRSVIVRSNKVCVECADAPRPIQIQEARILNRWQDRSIRIRLWVAETWESTGIGYVVDVDSPASAGELDTLLEAVDSVAEIPKSIAGATAERTGR